MQNGDFPAGHSHPQPHWYARDSPSPSMSIAFSAHICTHALLLYVRLCEPCRKMQREANEIKTSCSSHLVGDGPLVDESLLVHLERSFPTCLQVGTEREKVLASCYPTGRVGSPIVGFGLSMTAAERLLAERTIADDLCNGALALSRDGASATLLDWPMNGKPICQHS